jgi:hypothetical protein
MDPREIFELIVKSDEAIKYATEQKAVAQAHRARGFLMQALDEARAIGNESLVAQAERRLADLDALGLGDPAT